MNLVDLSFPPLMRGEAAPFGVAPFARAVAAASLDTDPGLIVHNAGGDVLSAALVLGPEAPLEGAMAMVFAAGLGFGDALGALAPPEVGVHLEWPNRLRVNGARAGRLRAAASTRDPAVTPDWLVVGLDVDLSLPEGVEPGADPETTALSEEGCVDLEPFHLLESWSRHTLVWINRWLDDGIAPLHADFRARAHGVGEPVTLEIGGETLSGLFVGLDEQGGMLLRTVKTGEETRLVPLSAMLED